MTAPHPVAAARTVRIGPKGRRLSAVERVWEEQRRRMIEQARGNGATRELRDGREFTVLHLPPQAAAVLPTL